MLACAQSNVKGSNCGIFMGGTTKVKFNEIIVIFQLTNTLDVEDAVRKVYKCLKAQNFGKDVSSYEPFLTLCRDIGTPVRKPSKRIQDFMFDGSPPERESIMPWSIAHVIDLKSLTSAKSAGQAIHYGRSLLRRSRSAAVVCHIYSQGGTFYRLSRGQNILCTEFAALAGVADALTRLLMTPPQYLGLNVDAAQNELWSIFEPLVPVWHGGSSLVFCKSGSVFDKYIPADDHTDDTWIAKVSQNSCADECAHLNEMYGPENYHFISLNDGEVMLSNMIGSLPTKGHWGSQEFLNSCWHVISQLHVQNMVHRDVRLPNFIIDNAGHGKVIDFQSAVAADELCVYHGTIETASP